MTLKELKEYVNQLPSSLDECAVILQKDAEGNGYSPLQGIDEDSIYVPTSTWSGDVYYMNHSAEDNCMEEEDWDELKEDPTKRCIVLFPIN